MHIGYRKIGNLMQTRSYVPGKNLWAALTARLTRDFPNSVWNKGYKYVGKAVQEQILFSYFWPSIDGKIPSYFWDQRNFDYLFLDSYVSTALDYSAYSHENGSLHEIEFLAPVARNEQPVYLLGDLWANEGQIDEGDWKISMEHLQIGGERTYGWGRLTLCPGWKGNDSGCGKTSTGHEWREKDDKIILRLNSYEKIAAHVLAFGKGATEDVLGPLEPIVGREWRNYAGQYVSYEDIYFVPGSEVKRALKFMIDDYGRWKFFEK